MFWRLITTSSCLLLFACGGSQTTAPPAPGPQPVVPAEEATAPERVEATDPATADQPEEPDPETPIADQYRDEAERIIEAALADEEGWKKLRYLTDHIGPRLSGSRGMQRAIAWSVKSLNEDGHENVRKEKVMVPHWVRGHEEAQIVAPFRRELNILGLGGTVATPKRGITGEVVVVRNWEHLKELGDEVKGKIVLYDVPMRPWNEEDGAGYGDTVEYRWAGPSAAAKLGAEAVLVRSVTAHSLNTPHTGSLGYEDGVERIPAAAVTVETAALIARLVEDGETVKVRLVTSGKYRKEAESANVIAELRGREKPEEVVVISGHLDAWDVGQGAHDDATGCVMMMQALTVLRKLELRPRRTIRVVLWTNEENGGRGADTYREEHADELEHHVMAMESDSGGFAPRGFKVKGTDAALEHTRDIISLFEPLGATEAEKGYSGADVHEMTEEAGVPTLGVWVQGDEYFDYHHTHADTLDKVDPEDFAKNIGMVAVMAYVVADMPERFGAGDGGGESEAASTGR